MRRSGRGSLRADAGIAAGLQILYGGSVKPQNAAELFARPISTAAFDRRRCLGG